MTNLYWSVYKNLEKEIISLSNQIHFDDKQLSIYSVKISELLIRCVVEIEAISKELYLGLGRTVTKENELYFDTDCIDLLENTWKLSKKKIIVSAQNFYFENDDNKVLTPLNKANKRGTSGSDWKRAYQAVKHNRVKSLKKGNLRNLIRAMASLFVLNIYYKDDKFDLQNDAKGLEFNLNLGSEIFSIKLHVNSAVSADGTYSKKEDFDECIYLTKVTDESAEKIRDSISKIEKKQKELTANHLLKTVIEEFKKRTDITQENASDKIQEIMAKEKENIGSKFLIEASRTQRSSFKNFRHEAILNKNQY